MKLRHVLIVAACALALTGCDYTNNDYPAYYTYVNDTDKVVTLTTYNGDYNDTIYKGIYVEPMLRFQIAPGESFTLSVGPSYDMGKKSINPPFWAGSATVYNGERMVINNNEGGGFFSPYYYECIRAKHAAYLKFVFTDKFFNNNGIPMAPEFVD